MDDHERTRQAWAQAAHKYVREHEQFLTQARTAELFPVEQRILAPVLENAPDVLHPMSGNGVDDIALVRAGARTVTGLDYDEKAVVSAQRRADELGHPVRYVQADVPPFPVSGSAFDLVYTGKGALVWVPDLTAWAAEVARVLRPGGHLFVHESHPMVPLYSWDADTTRIRADRDYFAASHVNDSFPGSGAVERQHTFAQIVLAVTRNGLELTELQEHPDPFWRMGDVDAAAWRGGLPNSFSLLARFSG
ncbi:class I SAM-dependent methyltransferase [Kineococcus sp. SYSU DK003]|uniref:class I SAM-dependent methyltransferase n=1 Tax=Kineococcus sp. SYSU DK003 TaxID=3383124 RepID=UPI003D7E8836